ncbi:ABC transporter permease [Aldersonia sp. NBC_00410]|uniref:ABC transporter permease n=1 Tax=Aldersonia sp. NBC_00410 TaxID=2975954 RepID=UPI00224E8C70|nr:ABC transporter permease [Aldersonia sp. NBC_00410]MCX5043941.1 ABC transporter permease [Aldersonia sp. NBC_00410]
MSATIAAARTDADRAASWPVAFTLLFVRWMRGSVRESWGFFIGLLQPVVWIVLFGQVFESIGAIPGFGDENYITFLVPGILMMTVLFSGAWAGTGYIEDIDSGVMNQVLTAPVRRSALLAGQLAQLLVVGLAQSLIVLVIGWLTGARYPGGIEGIVLALVAATLLAAIFCSCSNAVALTARSQVALIGISQMIVLPATFLSTAMMNPDLMPGWAQAVSRYNPVSWAVDIGRAGLAGTHDWTEIAWRMGLLTVLAALAFGWAISAFRSYQRTQ